MSEPRYRHSAGWQCARRHCRGDAALLLSLCRLFRLLAAAETFVICDDVQFPRRGRAHRCRLPGPGGALE